MSIRVFKINKEEVLSKLKKWAEDLGKDPNIVRVVLFGSLARGEATASSDADVLILLKDSKLRFDERIPLFLPAKVGIPVDVFPYTVEEFEKAIRERCGIGEFAQEEVVILYKRDES